MKKWTSSKHDSKALIERIQSTLKLNLDVPSSAQVENYEPSEGVRFIIVDGRYTFTSHNDELIPFLGCQPLLQLFPSVRVDEGAIKYVVNGADIMRPGVTSYDDWGDASRLIVVREDKKGRGIAIGMTLVKSADVPSMQKGACVKNIHYVGDKFWNLFKQI